MAGFYPGQDNPNAGKPPYTATARDVLVPFTADEPYVPALYSSSDVVAQPSLFETTAASNALGAVLYVPTAGLAAGMAIAGAGVASGALVSAVLNATSLLMSAPSTGIATGALMSFGSLTSQTATATAASSASTALSVPTAGLAAGMAVSGSGVTAGTTVASITDANDLVLSKAATVAQGATVTFSAVAVQTATTTAPTAPTPGYTSTSVSGPLTEYAGKQPGGPVDAQGKPYDSGAIPPVADLWPGNGDGDPIWPNAYQSDVPSGAPTSGSPIQPAGETETQPQPYSSTTWDGIRV